MCCSLCLISTVMCAVPQDAQLEPQHQEALRTCTLSVSSSLNKASSKHRDVHPAISRLGRVIDKVNEWHSFELARLFMQQPYCI